MSNGEGTRWAPLLTAWLRKVWDEWDVRILVLLSLFLQSILLILGKRRKYTNCDLCRNILWFAYLMADWVAIFALGKLSTAQEVSAPSYILRSLWAPLLLLHLGGADTITSYDYEDNQLWSRHLLTLFVKSAFAVYVIYLSWTNLLIWVSILTIPLMLAGTIKYVERIMCLYLSFTGQSGRALQMQYAYIPPEYYANNREAFSVVLAFIMLAAMRPDANNYISLPSPAQRLKLYVIQNGINFLDFIENLFDVLCSADVKSGASYQIATIQLGFMFDVVHTKAAIIYTNLGGILRLLSFCGSCCVSVLFLLRATEVSKYHFSRVDTFVTSMLMAGSVALELYAVWLVVSSDWALLLMLRFFKKVPCFLSKLMLKKRRWADRMGQFDLVSYCLKHRKENKRISSTLGSVFDFSRHWHTQYTRVPKELTNVDLLKPFYSSGDSKRSNNRASRGITGVFQKGQKDKNLPSSLDKMGFDEMETDQMIVIWHIATKVLYEVDHFRHVTLSSKIQGDEEEGRRDPQVDIIGDMELSKKISDYMMYLLVRRSSMLLPNHSRNFWLGIAIDNLKDLLKDVEEETNNMHVAAAEMLLQHEVDSDSDDDKFRRIIAEYPREYVQETIKCLVDEGDEASRWKTIRSLWTKILVHAAAECQHVNHIHELKRGSELLTVIWLMEYWDYLLNSIDTDDIF